MRTFTKAMLLGGTALAFATAADAEILNPEALNPEKTIAENAANVANFSTLVAAADAAGLIDELMGDGPYTVFAPTDEAFAALPEGTVEELLKPENRDQLEALLLAHVVPGVYTSDQISAAFLGDDVVPTDDATFRLEGDTLVIDTLSQADVLIDENGSNLYVSAIIGDVMPMDDGTDDGIRVIEADILASNGVIHAIDGVLMPLQ